jgi:hypothetical protein
VSLSSRSAIDGTDLVRHGGMGRLFGGARAPSTLGTFLRCFTFGHVRQLVAVAAGLLVNLAGCTPLLPGADQVAFVDVDDTVRETHGYARQGVGYGYTGTKGLNALMATVSTPVAAPGSPSHLLADEHEDAHDAEEESDQDQVAGEARCAHGSAREVGSRRTDPRTRSG